MNKKQELVNAVGAVAEMAWIFYMATRDGGRPSYEAISDCNHARERP